MHNVTSAKSKSDWLSEPNPRIDWTAFILLAVVDLLFLLIFFWIQANIETMKFGRFHIGADRSAPEIFGYFKWAAIVGILALYHRSRMSRLCLSFALIFCVILLDDSLELHENFGRLLVAQLGEGRVMGLRIQDYGELLFFIIFGLGVVYTIFRVYPAALESEKLFARYLVLLMIGLALFGVVLDMWHVGRWGAEGYGFHIGVAEDFGEQIMASLIFALVLGSLRSRSSFQKS